MPANTAPQPKSNPTCRARQQRGVTLFVVLVLIMLSMLLVLWASRTSLFNELVVGNDVDYQRTFDAAQALLQDAELDIRGEQLNGVPCQPDANQPKVCRQGSSLVQFPFENKDVPILIFNLENRNPKCQDGLCAKNTGRQDFWNDTNILDTMMQNGVGARYGEFTGAKATTGSNPVLRNSAPGNPPNKGGWYWIEVLPYVQDTGKSGLIAGSSKLVELSLTPNVLYRITAVARGLKTGSTGQPLTTVVLQETYARQKPQD